MCTHNVYRPVVTYHGDELMNSLTTAGNLRRLHMALASAALVLSTASAFGGDVKVELTGAEETPPVTTSAIGTGKITISADRTISGEIKTSGIEGTAAHIHIGAPGQSGPPIITLKNGPDGTWRVPSGAHVTDDQYRSFKSGNLYINVHSAEHQSGEIRAQLKP
jgi:hypothetical protein